MSDPARGTYAEGMTRGRRTAIFVLIVAIVLIAGGGVYLTQHGVSARAEPLRAEAFVARRLRHLAIPRGARDERNPLSPSPEVVEAGLAHFADHCAREAEQQQQFLNGTETTHPSEPDTKTHRHPRE